jgi:hypothetical protein
MLRRPSTPPALANALIAGVRRARSGASTRPKTASGSASAASSEQLLQRRGQRFARIVLAGRGLWRPGVAALLTARLALSLAALLASLLNPSVDTAGGFEDKWLSQRNATSRARMEYA